MMTFFFILLRKDSFSEYFFIKDKHKIVSFLQQQSSSLTFDVFAEITACDADEAVRYFFHEIYTTFKNHEIKRMSFRN